jgi:ATP-dependent Clp protease, protease subunit
MTAPRSRNYLPTITERTSSGEVTMDPYSKMLADRIVFLGAPVDEVTASDVAAQLLYLDYDNPEREISLYINSPSGSITAMLALYDTMRQVNADIQTSCLGQAGAAAAVLLAAGTPGKRLMLPHARAVLHQPAMQADQGQASDLEIRAAEMLRARAVLERILADHTGQPVERIHADLDRDTILTAPQALDYGLVDGVFRTRRQNPLGRTA